LTTYGHTVTMERVTVAQLKSRLSHYLREVRAGKSFTVVSRDIPVATLGPYDPDEFDDLVVIEPTEDPATWGQIDLPPLKLSRDIVDYLLEDRDDRDNRLDAIAHDAIEARRRREKGDQAT
jgi:prevent-host-death family protein